VTVLPAAYFTMSIKRRFMSFRNNYARRRCGAFTSILFLALVKFLVALPEPVQATPITIDFENEPRLPVQPNNFAAAGPMQILTSPGEYTVSGGVVLGNPTFLTAFAANGTPPNLYGTADFADPSLLQVITIDLPAAEGIFFVQGVLFNGQPIAEDYQLNAFSDLAQVDARSFAAVQPNSDPLGFRRFSLTSTAARPITRITLTTPNAVINGWDFFVDTVFIDTVSLQAAEPAPLILALAAALSLGAYYGWRNLKRWYSIQR
jgi:hypothetical protein